MTRLSSDLGPTGFLPGFQRMTDAAPRSADTKIDAVCGACSYALC